MFVWKRRNSVLGVSCFWQWHSANSVKCNFLPFQQQQQSKELMLFLGMTNYYLNFIPHYATIMTPLRNLLKKDNTWNWTTVPSIIRTSEGITHYVSCVVSFFVLSIDLPYSLAFGHVNIGMFTCMVVSLH